MKRILIIFILLSSFKSLSQEKKLIDYFFSENYNNKRFIYNKGEIWDFVTLKWEGDYIISLTERRLKNGRSMKIVDYYHPDNNRIINTVRSTSFSKRYSRVDELILKKSNSKWKDSSGSYSSYFTSVKTSYNKYNNCIAIKKVFINSGGGENIKFYALGIGLVKEETYNSKGKLTLTKELIDRQKTLTKKEYLVQNRVAESRKKFFSYKETNPNEFKEFSAKYTDRIINRLKDYTERELLKRKKKFPYIIIETTEENEHIDILFERKYNFNYKRISPNFQNLKNRELFYVMRKERITINKFPLSCLEFDNSKKCYEMSTYILIKNFSIQFKKGLTVIKKRANGKHKFYEKKLNYEIKEKLSELMKDLDKGKYWISYLIGKVNNKDASHIIFEKM